MNPVAGAIRTPDQRLRVFVSSTLKELAPERRAARAAIERLALAPVMFELGARPHPPRVAVPGLPRAERHLRRRVLGGVRLGRAGRGGVGPRGRVEPRPRHPEADLHQAQRAPAGAARRAARTHPRRRRCVVRGVHRCRRARGRSSPPTSRPSSPSASTPPAGRRAARRARRPRSFSTEVVRPAVAAHAARRSRGRSSTTVTRMLTDEGQPARHHHRPGRHRQEPARGRRGPRGRGGVPRRRRVRRPRARAGRPGS